MLTCGLIVTVAVATALMTGCGKTSFGGSGKQGTADRTGADGDLTGKPSDGDARSRQADRRRRRLAGDPSRESESGAGSDRPLPRSRGSNPFGQAAFTDYRVVNAAVNVLGSGPLVSDTQVTTTPRLIVVKAGVSVLGQSGYELMNPNGWYCLMVDVSVMAKVTVDLHCQANLADNKVNVNVGSNGSGAASVGVAVLSDIKVNRVGSGKTGC